MLFVRTRKSGDRQIQPNICDLVFHAMRAKHEFSIIGKNIRRSSRTFDVRQECSAFSKSIEYALASIFYDVLVRIFLFEFS